MQWNTLPHSYGHHVRMSLYIKDGIFKECCVLKVHNIIQIHNNVMWDWQYYVECSSHHEWRGIFHIILSVHIILLWIWILLCEMIGTSIVKVRVRNTYRRGGWIKREGGGGLKALIIIVEPGVSFSQLPPILGSRTLVHWSELKLGWINNKSVLGVFRYFTIFPQ